MSALQELQNYTFVSKYARWLQNENRRETWQEAVNRVRDMMLRQYKDCNITDDINEAYDFMLKKKILGSQRALQYGGKPMEDKNARCYNCVASYCDRLRFFQETFWLLLCGCGAGFSVQKHHIAKLPKFNRIQHSTNGIKCNVKKFVVPDTIEGWADALGFLLEGYFGKHRYDVEFDYSKIRPKGSRLSSGVGKAPGPEGLRNALQQIDKLLNRCVQSGRTQLRPIDAYDMVMHTSDAVLSGGVRRSATLCMFSPDDLDMMRAKIGNWRNENPQRARSNNSVILLRSKAFLEEFKTFIQHTKEFGEPGFIWVDDLEQLFNPCVEISLYGYDEHGNSGWQGCNLSTINCGNLKDKEDFYERCKHAALIGTLQAGFTNLEYLGPISESIFRREALLGVSMTGTMENFEIAINDDIQSKGAEIVKKINTKVAQLIGINPAARTTCLKPEGTASCLLGTSSGIHPHHALRYIRHQQVNRMEEPYKHFRKFNEKACELGVWSANDTDDVIKFPIEVPDGSKTKNQLPALGLLQVVKSTQQNWVAKGKVKSRCVQPWLHHNVSNTITVCDNEWEEITQYIYTNRKYFTGISLISMSGDKDYPQAPFVMVHTSREIVREYGEAAIWCSGLIELALDAFSEDLWKACDFVLKGHHDNMEKVVNDEHQRIGKISKNGNGNGKVDVELAYTQSAKRMRFLGKVERFADRYFEGNVKRLTYCMKDVATWKTYCDLRDNFQKVDYTTMLETEDNTTPIDEISCAGGTCLI